MAKDPNIHHSWEEAHLNGKMFDNMDDSKEEYDNTSDMEVDDEANMFSIPNTRKQLDNAELSQMEDVTQKCGMYNISLEPYKLSDNIFTCPVEAPDRKPSEWKNLLQDARKEEIEKMRLSDLPQLKEDNQKKRRTHWNEVIVEDMSYLDWDYRAKILKEQKLVDDMIDEFSIQSNPEQQHAFHIVANHVTSGTPKQLLMYMGGMGGTGKSQVIKALKEFFRRCNEGFKFIVMAPTGPAASQINGSTYHSVLCMHWKNLKRALDTARDNLAGVEYIFIDELSMISCYDFYKISERLSLIMNETELA